MPEEEIKGDKSHPHSGVHKRGQDEVHQCGDPQNIISFGVTGQSADLGSNVVALTTGWLSRD